MTWTKEEIREAFEAGNTGEYSHMVVAFDCFDYENYPIYVPQGEDPRTHRPSNGDRVDECYSYQMSWASQAVEHRAQHWGYTEPPAPQPSMAVDSAASEIELVEAYRHLVSEIADVLNRDASPAAKISAALEHIELSKLDVVSRLRRDREAVLRAAALVVEREAQLRAREG